MIFYLSHAIGTLDNFESMQRRQENIANAVAWSSYLMHATPHVITIPWYANVVALNHLMKDRALRDQTQVMRRCDGVLFVGSPAMGHQLVERSDARRWRLADVDLTDQTWYPPDVGSREDFAMRATIANRIDEAIARNRVRL